MKRVDFLNILVDRKSTIFVSLILYRLILDYSYKEILFPTWGYQGFMLEFNTLHIFLSWCFLLALSPLIIKIFRKDGVSSSVVSILILTSMIPTTTIIGFSNYNLEYVILMFLYWGVLLSFTNYIPPIVYKEFKTGNHKYLNNILKYVLIFSVVYISYVYTQFRFHFGFFDVYDLRLEAREFPIPILLAYTLSAANTILPIIFIYTLIKRKIMLSIVISIVIMLNFGIAGGKSVILLLFIALIGYFFVRNFNRVTWLPWGIMALVVASILQFKLVGSTLLSFFVIFRTIFLPSRINYIFYDFFSTRELDYFRQSILKWTGFDSPYQENIAFLIGYWDMGENGGRANSGLFSDAYSNMGLVGMLVLPLLVVLTLKLIDGAMKGVDSRVSFMVSVAVSLNLLSLPLSTALFTGGLLLLILYLYTIPLEHKAK